MAKTRTLDVSEVRLANQDFAQRLGVEEVTLDYNPEADALSITIGVPTPAMTEPAFDNLLYRVDPDTLKIVGFEILALFGDFTRNEPLTRKLLKGYLKELRTQKTGVMLVKPEDKQRFCGLVDVVV